MASSSRSPAHASASADGARGDREHGAFGEQLTQQPPLSRAERAAQRDLALTRFRPREQQARDVGAGDQQQERHRAGQQQHGGTHGADDLVTQRRWRWP